jgi:hypothetical protein
LRDRESEDGHERRSPAAPRPNVDGVRVAWRSPCQHVPTRRRDGARAA